MDQWALAHPWMFLLLAFGVLIVIDAALSNFFRVLIAWRKK